MFQIYNDKTIQISGTQGPSHAHGQTSQPAAQKLSYPYKGKKVCNGMIK